MTACEWSAYARIACGLEKLDGYIGQVRAAVESSGKGANTAWMIVSDHGFLE